MAREKQGYRDALHKFLHRHDDEEDEQREARMRKEMIFLSCSGWDFYEKCKTTSTIIVTDGHSRPRGEHHEQS